METITVILKRFMRLLPFLTMPNSYRRFHLEYFYPYPDVWSNSVEKRNEPASRGYLTRSKMHRPGAARGEPFS